MQVRTGTRDVLAGEMSKRTTKRELYPHGATDDEPGADTRPARTIRCMEAERRWDFVFWAICGLAAAGLAFTAAFRHEGSGGGAVLTAGLLFFTGIGSVIFAVRQGIRFMSPGLLEQRARDAWSRRIRELYQVGNWEVVIVEVGADIDAVVKAVRTTTQAEAARQAVEDRDQPLVSGLSRDSCEQIAASLTAVGATAVARQVRG